MGSRLENLRQRLNNAPWQERVGQADESQTLRRRGRAPGPGPEPAKPLVVNGTAGVQILISTHLRTPLLKDCLASIERAMEGLAINWLLIVGIDGPDELTETLLAGHRTGADRFVVFPFDKAPTVAVAKNRVLGLALAHKHEYPWLMLMDDDDIFLQARVTELLPAAVRWGHKFAAGNWESWAFDHPSTVSHQPILHTVRGTLCHFGPQLTVLHADLVPVGGHLFDPDVKVWEDVVAWHRLRSEGHEVALIDTPHPVFRQRVFPAPSASRPNLEPAADILLQEQANAVRLARYPLRSDVQSAATVCVGPRGHDEVRLMLTSFRLFGPKGGTLPVHVVCDPDSEELIHYWDLGPVVTHPLATEEWLEDTRRSFDSLSQNPHQELRLPSEVMAAKQTAMLKALEAHANVLYMDGDTVCVGDMDGDVFNPRGADACVTSHHRCHTGPMSYRYGFWQAGCAFVSNPAFVRDWVESFRHNTSYGDQHVLTGVIHRWVVDDLPRGYNVGPWSFYIDDPSSSWGSLKPVVMEDDSRVISPMPEGHDWLTPCREFERRVDLKMGSAGLFWRGRRLRTVHVHSWPDRSLPCIWRYNENLRLALHRMLEASPDPRHHLLVALMGEP